MIITIDGPAASGKSTVAHLLAAQLGYYYLYSGLLFRALAYIVKQQGIEYAELTEQNVSTILFNDRFSYEYDVFKKPRIIYKQVDITHQLKNAEIDQLASKISTYQVVRNVIVDYQRNLTRQYNWIADGRDCGTVVFPHAEHKFFLTASLEVRALRWQKDQASKGNLFTLDQAQEELSIRDNRDATRKIAPLIKADDAILIDNSNLSIEQTIELFLNFLNK